MYYVSCLVWVFSWVLRLCRREKERPHVSHLKAFSPVWTSLCRLSLAFSLNTLEHPGQSHLTSVH